MYGAGAVLRVVLDVNQIVSSLLSTRGLQRQLLDAWRQRAFLLLLAPGLIDEVAEVLARPKIRKKYPIPPEDLEGFLHLLRGDALPLPEAHGPGVCRDPDDDRLLGCAAAGDANYLVTGDGALLAVGRHRGVTILTAREFLALLAA
jgi:putative PIN family toxin of toxin-antitoxin system